MDRDSFILALIGELEKQKQLSPELSTRELTPAEIFRKLEFDYPDIEAENLDRLSDAIRDIATGPAPDWFCLSSKFIENMEYLINHKCSVGVVRLVRAAYLTLPFHLLHRGPRELSLIFRRDETSSWPDLLQCYAEFSYSSRVLLLSLKDSEKDQMKSPVDVRDFMPLLNVLSLLRISAEAKPIDSLSRVPGSLLEYLRLGVVAPDVSAESEVERAVTQAVSVELFFHWGYLLRDIMTQLPSSITLCLPELARVLCIASNAGEPTKSTGQTDIDDSLFLLTLGHLVDGLAASSTAASREMSSGSASRLSLEDEVSRWLRGFVSSNLSYITAAAQRALAAGESGSSTQLSRKRHIFSILTSVGGLFACNCGSGAEMEPLLHSSELIPMIISAVDFQISQDDVVEPR
jgi:hypothetical protein